MTSAVTPPGHAAPRPSRSHPPHPRPSYAHPPQAHPDRLPAPGEPVGRAEDVLPCSVEADDLWFSDDPAELERAKALCVGCPVRRACLAGALARREFCGVWGGEILERGEVIVRKRPRGRPSKADLARDAELAAARAVVGVA